MSIESADSTPAAAIVAPPSVPPTPSASAATAQPKFSAHVASFPTPTAGSAAEVAPRSFQRAGGVVDEKVGQALHLINY